MELVRNMTKSYFELLVFMESSGCMGFQFLKQRFCPSFLFFSSETLEGFKEEEKGIAKRSVF
jgi:hypothetical protein